LATRCEPRARPRKARWPPRSWRSSPPGGALARSVAMVVQSVGSSKGERGAPGGREATGPNDSSLSGCGPKSGQLSKACRRRKERKKSKFRSLNAALGSDLKNPNGPAEQDGGACTQMRLRGLFYASRRSHERWLLRTCRALKSRFKSLKA
jgi:hypothetical protein